ncbi:hypothetical protein PIROE2DRAFT_15554 [Piromyces sp. E2]|nr:hypothetical protein PIROE2DRAFT_15554 [Piromyces sp. E2]|eukprot:OUM59039.1 hypothetical protein PIROE2DRAFT_15554 [Piromyces sp. E2]
MYSFNNIKLFNVTTISKPIFNVLRKSFNISNAEIKYLYGTNDVSSATLINYNSESNIATMNIVNATISYCYSNNPLIKISAENYNSIKLENVEIKEIKSYGPIIENISPKSKMDITNFKFYNNSNLHTKKCGNIYMNKDIELYIKKSKFSQNYNNNSGGVLCLSNIKSIDLEIINSDFYGNHGLNGGAIYFDSEEDIDEYETYIKLFNNNFIDNIAGKYGGAIYSNYTNLYLADVANIMIKNNSAGIAGGGLFSPSKNQKTLISNEDLKFESNTANSYGNEIATHPSLVVVSYNDNKKYYNNTISVSSGSDLSFSFYMYDSQNIKINDKINYFNFISIKAYIQNYDKFMHYMISGNTCSFINGVCKMPNLKILGIQGIYDMFFDIENSNDHTIDIEKIKLNITLCNPDEIMVYSKNNLLLCEKPICFNSCSIESRASCKKGNKININSPLYNKCECNKGFIGDYCEKNEMVDFSNITKIANIVSSTLIFVNTWTLLILCIFTHYLFFGYELGVGMNNTDKIKFVSNSKNEARKKIRKKSVIMDRLIVIESFNDMNIDLHEIKPTTKHSSTDSKKNLSSMSR